MKKKLKINEINLKSKKMSANVVMVAPSSVGWETEVQHL